MTRGGDATDELFVVVKEPKAIHRISITTGLSMEQYAGAVCDVLQPEAGLHREPRLERPSEHDLPSG